MIRTMLLTLSCLVMVHGIYGQKTSAPQTLDERVKAEIDRLRSDVGIVYTRRGRIAMAITTDDNPVVDYNWDGEAEKLIWRISVVLQKGLAN